MPFMRFLALILIVAVFCLALVFTYQNKDQFASLTFGLRTMGFIPIFIIILGSFLLGVIFTSVIGIIEGMKMRVANARLKRRIKKLQAEVDTMRNLPLSGSPDEVRLPQELDDEDSAL